MLFMAGALCASYDCGSPWGLDELNAWIREVIAPR